MQGLILEGCWEHRCSRPFCWAGTDVAVFLATNICSLVVDVVVEFVGVVVELVGVVVEFVGVVVEFVGVVVVVSFVVVNVAVG